MSSNKGSFLFIFSKNRENYMLYCGKKANNWAIVG